MVLDDGKSSYDTSFKDSYRKKSRIKYLIEEIPTIEHMKKRRPDLYNQWTSDIYQLINDSKQDLLLILREVVTASFPIRVALIPQSIDNYSFWSLSFDSDKFTFIDLIKGFIPRELFDLINDIINSRLITKDILNLFMENLYVRVRNNIWLPRCELVLAKEKRLNIATRAKKKQNISSIKYIASSTVNSLDSDLVISNLGVIDFINSGRNWLDFTRIVNRFILISVILFF